MDLITGLPGHNTVDVHFKSRIRPSGDQCLKRMFIDFQRGLEIGCAVSEGQTRGLNPVFQYEILCQFAIMGAVCKVCVCAGGLTRFSYATNDTRIQFVCLEMDGLYLTVNSLASDHLFLLQIVFEI